MRKILLGGAAAISLAVAAVSGPANAACTWNGYNWDCAAPQAYYPPYAYQYAQPPYYGYAQTRPDDYGQYPQWNSTRYPGPRISGGRGN